MENIYKYNGWLVAVGIICILILPYFLIEGINPGSSFLMGALMSPIIMEHLRLRKERTADNICINEDNVMDFLNDLEDRINLAEKFILDSKDDHLDKELSRIIRCL